MTQALAASDILRNEGILVEVVNARFAKPVDADLVREVLGRHDLVFTVEEGTTMGGFGSAVLESAVDQGLEIAGVVRCGIPDQYVVHASRDWQLAHCGLDAESLAGVVRKKLARA